MKNVWVVSWSRGQPHLRVFNTTLSILMAPISIYQKHLEKVKHQLASSPFLLRGTHRNPVQKRFYLIAVITYGQKQCNRFDPLQILLIHINDVLYL